MDTHRPRRRSGLRIGAALLVVATLAAPFLVGVQGPPPVWTTTVLVGLASVSAVVWLLVRADRQRRRFEDELAAWADERARHSERLRITADLHDLVSHGLGLITVRAAVARTLTGPEGERERATALTDIERVSRETTVELRRMLTVVSDPGAAPLHPADRLEDLPAIVQAATAVGVRTALAVDVEDGMSPGVQLAVCAVVREALHNTIRHAGPTDAGVDVRRDGDDVVVAVTDAGPRAAWRPRPGAGHGLTVLDERVTRLGGTLEAGPHGDGFRLTARLPDVPA